MAGLQTGAPTPQSITVHNQSRVLEVGNPAGRREKAGDEIDAPTSGGRDDDRETVECRDFSEVGRKRRDIISPIEHGQVIPCREQRRRSPAQRLRQRVRHCAGLRRAGRKIKGQKLAVAADRQLPGFLGLEGDVAAPRRQPAEHDKGRGQCRVAAEIDLGGRGEPAQPVAVALRYEKGCFRQIVLGRGGLHDRVRQPGVERAHRGGVAGKRLAGDESIDLVKRGAHGYLTGP